jgi:hypothetical protein
MSASVKWEPIVLSAKVFGHISQGLYRTPAGAIKELVSNAYDAGSDYVKIRTGFPLFSSFSCEDNGSGISLDEFVSLMQGGIGNSYKRRPEKYAVKYDRPVIGRLGVGLLSLAQICTQFDIISHHEESQKALRATIKFPPYTRLEIDKILKHQEGTGKEEPIKGGEYSFEEIPYLQSKKGVKVFTKHLRPGFTRRMKDLQRYGNLKASKSPGPYEDFDAFIKATYSLKTKSLFFLSDYDQLIFGLAVASPLPYLETGRSTVLLQFPLIKAYQERVKSYNFSVYVDNLALARPISVPSDMFGTKTSDCIPASEPEIVSVNLEDGSYSEKVQVKKYEITIKRSDLKFRCFELGYDSEVNGQRLNFSGYLFQQTGRLYPKEIQGVLVRLRNVAIGNYSADALTYPFAEGPRFTMLTSEVLVNEGLEDALNIDRDSFNTLDPHYLRIQGYLHSLLHQVIFPESWDEEKSRNKRRREKAASDSERRFVKSLSKTSTKQFNSISLIKREEAPTRPDNTPIQFDSKRATIEIDTAHPLTVKVFKRKKYSQLVAQVLVAFERVNTERDAEKRRTLFYRLIQDIFGN